MLLDASKDPDLSALIKNTKGILFYSVPHHGTFMAEYSVNVRYLLFPSIEVRELCKGARLSFSEFLVYSWWCDWISLCLTHFISAQTLRRCETWTKIFSTLQKNESLKFLALQNHCLPPLGQCSKYWLFHLNRQVGQNNNRSCHYITVMLCFICKVFILFLPSELGIGDLIQVNVEHLNICKPENKNSFIYKRSLQFIQDALGRQRMK